MRYEIIIYCAAFIPMCGAALYWLTGRQLMWRDASLKPKRGKWGILEEIYFGNKRYHVRVWGSDQSPAEYFGGCY